MGKKFTRGQVVRSITDASGFLFSRLNLLMYTYILTVMEINTQCAVH